MNQRGNIDATRVVGMVVAGGVLRLVRSRRRTGHPLYTGSAASRRVTMTVFVAVGWQMCPAGLSSNGRDARKEVPRQNRIVKNL